MHDDRDDERHGMSSSLRHPMCAGARTGAPTSTTARRRRVCVRTGLRRGDSVLLLLRVREGGRDAVIVVSSSSHVREGGRGEVRTRRDRDAVVLVVVAL